MQKRFVARSCHLSSPTPLAANIFSEFFVFSFGVFSFCPTVLDLNITVSVVVHLPSTAIMICSTDILGIQDCKESWTSVLAMFSIVMFGFKTNNECYFNVSCLEMLDKKGTGTVSGWSMVLLGRYSLSPSDGPRSAHAAWIQSYHISISRARI